MKEQTKSPRGTPGMSDLASRIARICGPGALFPMGIGRAFGVSEQTAYAALEELSDGGFAEVHEGKWYLRRWPDGTR